MHEQNWSEPAMKGNTGKILHVDLTMGSFAVETPDETFYRTYVGGACMGAYYVMRLVPAGADPLGPQNVLVFTTSAITGARWRNHFTPPCPLRWDRQTTGAATGVELKFTPKRIVLYRKTTPIYL
jgi:aldehyde:ferredoxin oxidoreductase